MLPKIEEALNQFVNTEYEDVRKKCVIDMLEYESIDNVLDGISEFIERLEITAAKAHDLKIKLKFHKELKEMGK